MFLLRGPACGVAAGLQLEPARDTAARSRSVAFWRFPRSFERRAPGPGERHVLQRQPPAALRITLDDLRWRIVVVAELPYGDDCNGPHTIGNGERLART